MKIEKIWSILEHVCDPEIPVLSVVDLGVVREIKFQDDKTEIYITPTYNGCPAMDMIAVNIKAALQDGGIENVIVHLVGALLGQLIL